MKIILALFLVLSLSACNTVNGKITIDSGKITMPPIDSSLLKSCNLPTKLPHRQLTQAEVEHYWSIDRKNLVLCAKKHGYLGDAIKFIDGQIEALSPPAIKK